MRNLVRKKFMKAAALSKMSAGKAGSQPASNAGQAANKSKKPSAKRLPSAETEASGTGSSQTWEDYGEYLFFYRSRARSFCFPSVNGRSSAS